MKTKVTKQIIQKCVLELYYNTYYSRKQSIRAIAKKLELSTITFTKVVNILRERGVVYLNGERRGSVIIWNMERCMPNEKLYDSVYNEYHKKTIAIQRGVKPVNKLSLSKCLAYLKEQGYSGEIYKIKLEDGIKIKTSYHI